MSRLVQVLFTGRITFEKGLEIQKNVIDKCLNSNSFRNTIIITEHEPVYTIGIRTKGYNTKDEEKLRKLGADFYKTNRGGLITFHGPGQLVAYPILNLKEFKPSMRWYVGNIEATIIHLCSKFGITATTSPDTGVWVDDRKICAIGVHGSRYITSHGLALNCSTDLSWFDHIVPCGIIGKSVTSISKELNRTITIKDVVPEFLESFKHTFDCTIDILK